MHLFFNPAAGVDDFGDGFGGFFCPHFDEKRATVIEAGECLEDLHEVHATVAKGDVAELAFAGRTTGLAAYS